MIKLNGVEIKPTIFPDGTSQVWKVSEDIFLLGGNTIEWEFEKESEFIHVAQLIDLVRSSEFSYVQELYMPYMPYSRQDKDVSNENTFAKKTFMKLLYNLHVTEIITLDCHSKKYLNYNIVDVFPKIEIDNALESCKPSMICFPDEGAKARYDSSILHIPSCSFSKNRNQKTGLITGLFLNELVDIKSEKILIIDDICDGGMTFKLTAEKLLTLGAKEVNLYTTHGIYSKGLDTLRESGINRIFNRKGEVK